MSRPSSLPPKPIDEQAADWAARLDGGPLSHAEADALQTWLDAAEGNEALLEEFQQLHGRVRATLPAMHFSAVPTRRGWPWARGLAAAAAIALTATYLYYRPQAITTEAAERHTLALADGTRADLNARTALSVQLHGRERHVTLTTGEAYFAVAKDPSRPFFVDTPHGTVRVTGTHFNVRADDTAVLEVTVLEGSVAVHTNATDFALKARDQLAFDGAKTDVTPLTADAADDAILWREGRIAFDGVPVRVAIERFAHYHNREIEVSPAVETLRLGGQFQLDDFEGFLRDVAQALPVRVLHGENNRVRIVPR